MENRIPTCIACKEKFESGDFFYVYESEKDGEKINTSLCKSCSKGTARKPIAVGVYKSKIGTSSSVHADRHARREKKLMRAAKKLNLKSQRV